MKISRATAFWICIPTSILIVILHYKFYCDKPITIWSLVVIVSVAILCTVVPFMFGEQELLDFGDVEDNLKRGACLAFGAFCAGNTATKDLEDWLVSDLYKYVSDLILFPLLGFILCVVASAFVRFDQVMEYKSKNPKFMVNLFAIFGIFFYVCFAVFVFNKKFF